MKAITIYQPYAWLITLPTTDPRHKRVENRTWFTYHRGPILIHAGKGKQWIDSWTDITPLEAATLVYGAIIGQANLVDCIRVESIPDYIQTHRHRTWLLDHQHAHGPWCWILEDVLPCAPIPCSGKQQIWEYTP